MAPIGLKAINTVAVIGAGVLGSCIAYDLSMHGVQVILYDRNPEMISPEALHHGSYSMLQPLWRLGYIPQIMVGNAVKNIIGVHTLEDVAKHEPQLILEAIPEDIEMKIQLFRALEKLTPPSTIFGTSTITLNINDIAAACERPSNIIGIRFLYPCVMIPFVELTLSEKTSQEQIKRIESYLNTVHKRINYGPTHRILHRSEINMYQLEQSKSLGFYHETIPMAKPIQSSTTSHHH